MTFDERFEEPWTTRSTRNHQSPEAAHAKAAGLAAAVIDDLAAIRTGIVRAALAKRFDIAFDLAAYLLVMDTSTRGAERPADIRLVRTSLRPMGRSSENDFAAASPGEKLDSPPAGKWMKLGDDLKRFDAFRALPDAEKQDLFAPRRLGRAPQPGRQPAPRAADRRTRGRAPRHRLRPGRPAHREVLLEAADPRPDARDRGGRRRRRVGEGTPEPQEGAARRGHGRRVRG